MTKNVNHVSHIKSKQITVDGKPKLPEASSLVEGEIAINFAEGVETISTKNESGNVVTFSSDEYYTSKKLGSGFTGENSGKTVTEAIKEANVQSNWTETDTASDAYIQNKPTLGTAASKGVSNGITNSDNLIEAKHIYSGVGVTITYDSGTKYLQLKNASGSVISSFDASAFIKDGMVDNVVISGGNLVITFNTDSGKEAISIPLTDIFDPSNYLTKEQLTGATDYTTVTKANSANTASTVALTGVTDADDLKAIEALTGTSGLLKKTAANTWSLDTTAYSSATEVQAAINGKANTATTLAGYGITDAYTKSETSGKTEIQNALATKTDTATTTALNDVVTAHTGNTDVHVTTGDKATWNAVTAKTDNSAFTAHTGNTDIHVTTDDKETWNTAASGVTDLSGQSETIAAALVDLNSKLATALANANTALANANAALAALDGVTIQKITQAEYDALTTKDPNTLYVITD